MSIKRSTLESVGNIQSNVTSILKGIRGNILNRSLNVRIATRGVICKRPHILKVCDMLYMYMYFLIAESIKLFNFQVSCFDFVASCVILLVSKF
jgi:hypothetical protein